LFSEYLDNTTIRVIEGGVPETTALLDQKWDKIFFTGLSSLLFFQESLKCWLGSQENIILNSLKYFFRWSKSCSHYNGCGCEKSYSSGSRTWWEVPSSCWFRC